MSKQFRPRPRKMRKITEYDWQWLPGWLWCNHRDKWIHFGEQDRHIRIAPNYTHYHPDQPTPPEATP